MVKSMMAAGLSHLRKHIQLPATASRRQPIGYVQPVDLFRRHVQMIRTIYVDRQGRGMESARISKRLFLLVLKAIASSNGHDLSSASN